jgi:nucleoside-diphosphate kinase
METVLVIKPDAVAAGKADEIIEEVCSRTGLNISKSYQLQPTLEQVQQHYEEHKSQAYYEPLCNFMVSGPMIVVLLSGKDAVTKLRAITKELRNVYATDYRRNAVHTSDSESAAKREKEIWF